ncbi:MAG: hypothetical protein HFE63_03785 [Clostridiales bacterium]|nr:hypothetical protein [Clostridiales bacterium]
MGKVICSGYVVSMYCKFELLLYVFIELSHVANESFKQHSNTFNGVRII